LLKEQLTCINLNINNKESDLEEVNFMDGLIEKLKFELGTMIYEGRSESNASYLFPWKLQIDTKSTITLFYRENS
jgi:hypothetical protein